MGKVLVGIIVISLFASAYYAIGIALLVCYLPYALIMDIKENRKFKRYREICEMYWNGQISISEKIEMLKKEGMNAGGGKL